MKHSELIITSLNLSSLLLLDISLFLLPKSNKGVFGLNLREKFYFGHSLIIKDPNLVLIFIATELLLVKNFFVTAINF